MPTIPAPSELSATPVKISPSLLERSCTVVASALLLLCIGGALVSLVAHHFMGRAGIWSDHMIRSSLIWIVMLGAVEPLGRRGHRHLRLFHRKGKLLTATVTTVRTLTQALTLAFIFWTGFKAMGQGMEATAVPLGAAVMLVTILLRVFRQGGGHARQ